MRRRALGLALLAGGCAVGPNFKTPMPPTVTTYTPAPAPTPTVIGIAGRDAQRFVAGAPVPERWWTTLGSPALNMLVDQAIKANTDIRVADATLFQSREQSFAAGYARFPTIDANYQFERAKTSATLSPALSDGNILDYQLHTAQLSLSYTFDLFGGTRRQIEAARATYEAQRYRSQAARLTVISNTVVAAIQEASLRDQLATARATVATNQRLLGLLQKRQALGAIGLADIAAEETVLAQAQATVPPLEKSLVHQQAALSVLIGREPSAPLPARVELAELTLPADLPVTLPSDLVRYRPDIRSAEAQLHGASAQVGVAIAARLPAITLTANAGGIATSLENIFAGGNPFYGVIAGVTQPLFHGFQLRHNERAARAGLQIAEAQYRGTVLNAYVEVSDALTALRTDADALTAATRANAAARQSLGFNQRQVQLGTGDTLTLLNAQTAAAQTASQLVQARAARFSDTAALFQALGGSLTETGR